VVCRRKRDESLPERLRISVFGLATKCQGNCFHLAVSTAAATTMHVRHFAMDDVPAVSRMWWRVFAPGGAPYNSQLEAYFADIFLNNPWSRSDLTSLVCESHDRKVLGFVGVVPRQMRLCGIPLTVAVASQFMVDPDCAPSFASALLLRHLFDGPQDLSFSDGANHRITDPWIAAGGRVALLYSCVWTRVLRPASYAALLCRRRYPRFPLRAAWPFCAAVDAFARIPESPYKVARPLHVTSEEGGDPSELLECIQTFSSDRPVRPEYDLESLRWLLSRAAAQGLHGPLRQVIVNRRGKTLGWYLYYLRPNDVAQVLQIGGDRRHASEVLQHLFHRAHAEKAVAVSGNLEPAFAQALAGSHCSLGLSGSVIVHSHNERLLDAIHRGDAFLSRLEGEWWMRFCDFRGKAA
jgi:hypothetical protein